MEGDEDRAETPEVERLRPLRIVLTHIAPILLIWMLCFYHLSSTYSLMVADADRETNRLARIVEENTRRTVSEVERTIGYLREMYAYVGDHAAGDKSSWANILEKQFASSAMVAQVAAIDKNGFLISSSGQLHPIERMYLGDRDHISAHLGDPSDKLYISTPVLGRVSGKWTIQFTRPFFEKDRVLGGVLVVSLNVDYLALTYRNMEIDERSGIALLNPRGVILAGRGPYAEQYGLSVPPEALQPATVDDTGLGTLLLGMLRREEFKTRVLRSLDDIPVRILFENRAAAAHALWLSNARNHIAASAALSLCSFLLTTILVRRRRAYEQTLNRLAFYDPLTGLANRRAFSKALRQRCLEGAPDSELIVIVVAVDQIKGISDRYGQSVADNALAQAAERLSRQFEDEQTVIGRLSDDEFAIVARAGNADCLNVICKSALAVLRVPFYTNRQLRRMTCSIGAARMAVEDDAEARLMNAASFALREAKRQGGDRYQLYDRLLHEKVERELRIEAELIDALEDNQLDVYFQPVVHTASRTVVGYEALVRWRKEDGSFVSPAEFVPLAEARGLVGRLDRFVIDRVFSLAHRLITHPGMAISINISASELHNGDVLNFLTQCASRYDVNPVNIRIEITETAILHDIDIAVDELHQLIKAGFHILLDDFGTGYSSLSYLLRFPLSGIKIDRSFVHGLNSDPRDRVIVSSIVHIARELGLRVVAEGVETEQEAAILCNMGVDFLQGYMFGRPSPIDALAPTPASGGGATVNAGRRAQSWEIATQRLTPASPVSCED